MSLGGLDGKTNRERGEISKGILRRYRLFGNRTGGPPGKKLPTKPSPAPHLWGHTGGSRFSAVLFFADFALCLSDI